MPQTLDHLRLARSASERASSLLADAVRGGKQWRTLDRLVRDAVDCFREEDLLDERLLWEAQRPSVEEWLVLTDPGSGGASQRASA